MSAGAALGFWSPAPSEGQIPAAGILKQSKKPGLQAPAATCQPLGGSALGLQGQGPQQVQAWVGAQPWWDQPAGSGCCLLTTPVTLAHFLSPPSLRFLFNRMG